MAILPDDTPSNAGPVLEPIAIIGYACRLSGDVTSPNDLWSLCTRARSGWRPIPKERFSHGAYHHPNPSKPGTFNPAGGYFLDEDVFKFDAPFFNVSVQEATSMDPQQRLLLETSYEALESAGIPKESLAGRNVGVFVGGNFSDYELNNLRDIETTPAFQATGNAPALQSNRISYYFDFSGPSLTVDTACSSSMVALHYAVQSLRSGESSEALVGGCRLNILPDCFVSMSMSQLFNDEGKTYSFDERAKSGFARGEGAGVVMLKPLAAALRDKDPIRAVIANSGVNQDGRTKGITLPNGKAQEELIKRVYKDAHIKREDCGYVEMHGTGTKTGDPIEAQAVQRALGGGDRTSRNPLYIGSVKSNVGHLEGASGVVSIIKAAMILEKGLLLPNCDFKKPHPNIPLHEWNMKVVTSTRPFPRGKKYVSVSNYGFGGTNAHVVLERPPPLGARRDDAASDGDPKRRLFVLSAGDKDSLKIRIHDFCLYFEQNPEVFENSLFGNFCYSTGSKMSQLAYRVAVTATSLDELGTRLAQLNANPRRVLGPPKISWVFTGQGAQWPGMGTPLMDEYPAFASTMVRADQCLRDLGAQFSLLEELRKEPGESQINSPLLSQPACTALQLALTDLLRSWGIQPDSVVGHSSGEIGAAYAAGIFDLEAAMALAYYRGQMATLLKSSYPALRGTMIAVGASPVEIRPMLKLLKAYATIACVNSPSSVTVSGDVDAISELEAILNEKSTFNRLLNIDVAYHSNHMGNVTEAYLTAIQAIKPTTTGTATFFSSVTGGIAEPADLGPAYWVQNLTSTVLFADALGKMCADDESRPNMLIELGPHSALKGPILDTLKGIGAAAAKISYAPTLVRKSEPSQSLLDTAGAAYVRGVVLNMTEINFPSSKAKNRSFLRNLPRYPWQHNTRYWHHSRIAEKHCHRDDKRNDILGTVALYSNDLEPTWRNIVRLDDVPWLREHKMQGMSVYPMAGYLAMAIEAAKRRAEQHGAPFSQFEFREVKVSAALVLTEDVDTETVITLRPYAEGTRGNSDLWDDFCIYSWNTKRSWTEHCTGLVRVRSTEKQQQTAVSNVAETELKHMSAQTEKVIAAATYKIDIQNMYRVLSEVGAGYGACFQGLENCFSDPRHSRADLYLRDTKKAMYKEYEAPLSIHPVFLDALLHLAWPILGKGRMELETLYMPTIIRNLVISANIPTTPGNFVKAWCIGGPSVPTPQSTEFDLWVTPQDSTEVLINMEGLVMTPLKDTNADSGENVAHLCYKIEWQPLADGKAINGHTTDEELSSRELANGELANGELANGELANGELANGHAVSSELTNGTTTNGKLTKSHAVNGELTNGHAHDDIGREEKGYINGNGVNGIHTRELLIMQYGKSDGSADKLSEAVSTKTNWNPSIHPLGVVDSWEKHILVLQTGTTSLRDATVEIFDNVKKTLLNASHLLWVYRLDSPDAQMIIGLTRSLRSEGLLGIAALGLEAKDIGTPTSSILAAINALWPVNGEESCKEREFRACGSQLLVPRVTNDTIANLFVHKETQEKILSIQPFYQPGRRLKLEIARPGSIDTLYFTDDNVNTLGDDDIEIEVKATGLNFKDIVVTMGQLAQSWIGIECSGVVSSIGKNVTSFTVGQRVMALPEGAYSTYAQSRATSAAPLPENMSFEVGATIPVVFCTAYYALIDLGRLEAGERVLIHAGAGGVGQAAIKLAQMIGAEIFVTVSSVDKKSFLKTQYGIPEDHIFYSRDSSFGRGIRRATSGRGVDIVVNSLAGDLLRETWMTLAPFGRFIEIGKADITKNTRLDMLQFENNVSFASVDLTKIAQHKPRLMRRLLDNVYQLMSEGTVSPILPLTSYRISELETAFRTLQTGKAMGKIVIAPHKDDQVKAVVPKLGSSVLSADVSYLLIGGTGGLGRSIARWMSSKGARNIVLVSRSASINTKVQALIDELAAHGTTISVKPCDVSDMKSVNNLINQELKGLPPVRGVVHGAMVLRDMLFEKTTLADFQAVASCKVEGAWNLHHALHDSPLDFFVALSSVAGIIGNRGQAAYAAANAFLDGFMEYRRSRGLPGTTIDLTAVRDVGYLAEVETKRREEVLKNIGTDGIDEAQVLALLGAAVTGTLLQSCSGQSITGLDLGTRLDHFWVQDSKFCSLYEAAKEKYGNSTEDDMLSLPLKVQLANAPSKVEAQAIVYEALAAKLAQVLVMPPEELNPETSIAVLGVDSLVAIEIRNWISREAHSNVQVLELLSSGSLMALAGIILNNSTISFSPS